MHRPREGLSAFIKRITNPANSFGPSTAWQITYFEFDFYKDKNKFCLLMKHFHILFVLKLHFLCLLLLINNNKTIYKSEPILWLAKKRLPLIEDTKDLGLENKNLKGREERCQH